MKNLARLKKHVYLCRNNFSNNKMMVQANKKTESKAAKQQEPENKKISKYAQYLKTEYRRVPITNMRAVLK
jgi:hypothetical protein